MSRVLFIDISKWQNVPNWQDLGNSGLAGVIIKASEGLYKDAVADFRFHSAITTPLVIGGYHFGIPIQDPIKQVDLYLSVSEKADFHSLDLEWTKIMKGDAEIRPEFWSRLTPIERVKWLVSYAKRIKEHSNKKLFLYTNNAFWQEFIHGAPGYEQIMELYDGLWQNKFTGNSAPIDRWMPKIHQFTDHYPVAGIGNVDADYWLGSYEDLWKFLGISIPAVPSYNPKVEALQRHLQVNPDGKYGMIETIPAVKKWQEANGFDGTGVITSTQWQKMFDIKNY